MNLLSGKDASYIADGVYRIFRAENSNQIQQTISRNIESDVGIGRIGGVSPVSGLMGKSGAFVKEQTGFGAVLERNVGINRELIVVMRGTQSNYDWLSNFNVGFDRGPDGSMVHAGFNRVYNTLADELRTAIARNKAQQVHFVGHSLGGALATIAASEFSKIHKMNCSLYTFGAPRVGSIGLSDTLKAHIPSGQIKRVYAISDPVPMIPFLPFFHSQPGSIGINAGFTSITADAHSMPNCYVTQMPSHGWPPTAMLPTKSDPEHWLRMADQSSGMFSWLGYKCLGLALAGLMSVLHAMGIVVGASMTVLDQLIEALRNAVLISKKIGDQIFRWIKIALKIAGRAAISASITTADLTLEFLRFVFELLSAPVKLAAQLAISKLR